MANTYLTRTYGSTTNRRTYTWSIWLKRANIGTEHNILSAGNFSGEPYMDIRFNTNQTLEWYHYNSGYDWRLITNRVFRDPSAWYHVVLAVDTTQGTSSNRVKLYINGVQETAFETYAWGSAYPSQNFDTYFNDDISQAIGSYSQSSGNHHDGYISEFVMIDGQQLTPTSFGEFDEDSGIWKPKAVSGLTFGTNGFYLDFEDSGALGDDVSGNGNDFTVNNLTAVDQSTDTPTNNFCTLNPLQIGPRNNQSESAGTFSEGNLNVLGTGTADDFAGTIAVSTGKWFYEVKLLTALNHGAGFTLLTDFTGESTVSNGIVNGAFQYGSHEGGSSSRIANNGDTSVSPQNNFDDDDIISFAFDIDGGTLKIYNNGSLDRTISSIPAGTYIPIGGDSSSTDASLSFNFGSPSYSESGGNSDGNGYGNFSMAVPSGYYALCTKNLAEYG